MVPCHSHDVYNIVEYVWHTSKCMYMSEASVSRTIQYNTKITGIVKYVFKELCVMNRYHSKMNPNSR